MARGTSRIKNRLLLEGCPAFEAPYLAREAVQLGQQLAISDEADIVRLAVILHALGPTLAASARDREAILTVLGRTDTAASARLNFIEQAYLRPPPNKHEGPEGAE